MFCIAYLMRRDGVKLPTEQIRAEGKRGWLTFARMPAGQPVWTAKLTGPSGGDIFPELTCAEVTAISRGVLVKGLVLPPGDAIPQRQTWYCQPTEAPEGFDSDGRPHDGRSLAGRRG